MISLAGCYEVGVRDVAFTPDVPFSPYNIPAHLKTKILHHIVPCPPPPPPTHSNQSNLLTKLSTTKGNSGIELERPWVSFNSPLQLTIQFLLPPSLPPPPPQVEDGSSEDWSQFSKSIHHIWSHIKTSFRFIPTALLSVLFNQGSSSKFWPGTRAPNKTLHCPFVIAIDHCPFTIRRVLYHLDSCLYVAGSTSSSAMTPKQSTMHLRNMVRVL